MSVEHYRALFEHHAWAVERLLDAASRVPDAQLHDGSLSHGSLFATLVHMADVDQSWGRRARGSEELSEEEVAQLCTDLQSLRRFWLPEIEDLSRFIAALEPADLERDVHVPWRPRPFKTWEILVHAAIHRAEHGNQVGWQLSELGAPPGELGFLAFTLQQRKSLD